MRNLYTQFSPPHKNSYEGFSRVFEKRNRKTLGSVEDEDETLPWNKPNLKESRFFSSSKNLTESNHYNKLFDENLALKMEIRRLERLIFNNQDRRNHDRGVSSTWSRKDESGQQIEKMKRIIEKSYYSLKEMEKQIAQLKQEVSHGNKSLRNLQKKLKVSEIQRQELESKIITIISVHKQQINLCNDRIKGLQFRLNQLMGMMEQDQMEWRKHKEDLTNFKKFYFKGTSK